jgi:hypothetical protein
MDNFEEIKKQLNIFFGSLFELRNLGVAPNSKDFTSQLGEWLVSEIFNGKRAQSGIQKDWDVKVDGKNYQVKTHAKSVTDKNKWSYVNYKDDAEIDFILLIVFTPDYKLKEFYKISWEECLPLIRERKDGRVINWSALKNYRLNIDDLNNQELISLFR